MGGGLGHASRQHQDDVSHGNQAETRELSWQDECGQRRRKWGRLRCVGREVRDFVGESEWELEPEGESRMVRCGIGSDCGSVHLAQISVRLGLLARAVWMPEERIRKARTTTKKSTNQLPPVQKRKLSSSSQQNLELGSPNGTSEMMNQTRVVSMPTFSNVGARLSPDFPTAFTAV